jgi:hypothetical protein
MLAQEMLHRRIPYKSDLLKDLDKHLSLLARNDLVKGCMSRIKKRGWILS